VVAITFLSRPAIILSHVQLRPAAVYSCHCDVMIHIRKSKEVVHIDAMKPFFLRSLLDAEWSAVSRHCRFALLKKKPFYPLTRRIGLLQSRSAWFGWMKNPMPLARIEPQTFRLYCSQYTDWGIRATLHFYIRFMYNTLMIDKWSVRSRTAANLHFNIYL